MDKTINYDASVDESFEERESLIIERDDSKSIKVGNEKIGKISRYKYHILVRDKEPLTGTLSREEVDLIHRLYSSEGSNLSQRTVSREFPNLTFQDFKKILRALNITKASSPMAPHTIEEKSTEDLVKLVIQNKENDFLRKLEQDRARLTEAKLKEITKNYYELKQQVSNFSEFVSSLDIIVGIDVRKPLVTSDRTLMVYLSDMHIGADVSAYSIYSNDFNYESASLRMIAISDKVQQLAKMTGCTNIVVCNIGDSLDGYNGQTTRGGHALPQNMNNKDQFKNYLKMMINFFAEISSCGLFSTIKYYAVEGGNHDGDFGYVANKALEASLSIINPEIETTIFDKYIEHFQLGNHTFILTHGKDAKDMFRNMPLTINDKTENQINEYLDYHNLQGNIHFIKGDLHQSATTYAKRFRYKSVASFFGSSEWIHKNFGNTLAAIDFDIVEDSGILETRLVLN